jgi:ABC-type polysaccharide/polyol phosphate transport system ATPase subunit
MNDVVLEVEAVSKKFRRGETYDSLRDLIPAMTGRLFRAKRSEALENREFWALKDVSFQLRRGEALGIMGGNGAGKSTLLKLLCRIMRPTSGRIQVTGRMSALIEVSAGFHPDLTGRENVFLNGSIMGMSREQVHRRFDEIVAFSGLEEFIDTPVKRYSSGMFARLGFSVAAHVDPEVLLVDEVLSVGDYLFQQKCVDHMTRIIEDGVTVVFISHNLRAIGNLCSRSILLERGRASAPGPTAEVLKNYLSRGQVRSLSGPRPDLEILGVTTHGTVGPSVQYQTGDRMWVTVTVRANTDQGDATVVIRVVDDQKYALFDTCTQRLGTEPISLKQGQHLSCSFVLDLSLAEGTFHIDAFVHRYTNDRPFDKWIMASTFFVSGSARIRGIVDLRPELESLRISDGELLAGTAPTADAAVQARGRD